MTTIAASLDFQMIAADSRCCTDTWMFNVSKLRSGVGTAFGAAGTWEQILKFYAAIEQNADLSSECDVEVLELRQDSLWIYNGSLTCFPIRERFWAVGTGAPYAISAMHLGKSPVEAIEIAALFDASTGGPIDLIRIPSGEFQSKRRRVHKPI